MLCDPVLLVDENICEIFAPWPPVQMFNFNSHARHSCFSSISSTFVGSFSSDLCRFARLRSKLIKIRNSKILNAIDDS